MNGMMSAARTMTAEICGPDHVVVGMAHISGKRDRGVTIRVRLRGSSLRQQS